MTKSGNPVYRNPGAPHVIPMLPNFFAFLRVMNAMWTPDALALLSEVGFLCCLFVLKYLL